MNDSLIADLKSKFGESGNFRRTVDEVESGRSVVWDSCLGSSFALLGASLAEKTNRTLLVVVSNVSQVEHAASDLELLSGRKVLTYPVLSIASIENSKEIFLSEDADFGARLRVLKALDSRSEAKDYNDPAPIIVASLAALLQPVPSRDQIIGESVKLTLHEEYNRDKLTRWLTDGGFQSTSAVELPGEYSVRGDIVDVYAIDWERPVRLEFFGDEIDSIRTFDVVDQRSIDSIDSIEISRLETRGDSLGRFVERLPNDSVVLLRETDLIIGETTRLVSINEERNRGNASVADTVNALYAHPCVHAVSLASGTEFADLTLCADFTPVDRFHGDLTQVMRALNDTKKELTIGIVCSSEIEIERLKETLYSSEPSHENRILYTVGYLTDGFEWREGNLALIGSDQLFGHTISRRSKSTRRGKKLSKVIDSFLELAPGDLVVHVDHGLARYLGIEKLKQENQEVDQLKLEFADSVYLYVPTSKIRKIQRYVGAGKHTPSLAKLHGTTWEKQKKEAREAIQEYAKEMLRIQAARNVLTGIAFPKDQEMQARFESQFPYQETPDQLTTIAQVKEDMERPRPMDRLICGDVGFGKTEIALRAAFKALEADYQVAILVPTTVLAAQHFKTFKERLASFPFEVASLSRYSNKKEQAQTIEKLKEGRIHLVIGTHRVIQKDVKFKNLGLVVIDEEQKFGVKDKEKLKAFRSVVDVLTMTATPIPRTLHYSLLGIRDISNLTTPPADRLPVETKVVRFDPGIVREAVLRELNRGGQIYYIHNQVYDIEEVAAKLQKIVPEARIRIGHAQMSTSELEKTMRDFVLKKFDLLLCTTIVESGLDIPNANTIFIDKAERFGLAELHQLRGRVGREKKQAYCYLTLESGKILTGDAVKRLHALEEYDKLGSGFQIAMKDLEIRGSGNILGVEQSGHIAMIGYEMYCDFLESAIAALTQKETKKRIEVDVELPGAAVLSDKYVPDSKDKIDFYRRFARVSNVADAIDLRKELEDRFGPLTPEAKRLFVLAEIRIAADRYKINKIGITQIKGLLDGDRLISITFPETRLRFQLQEELKSRKISLQLTQPERTLAGPAEVKGYVKIPKRLFNSNGDVEVDRLLKFTLELFNAPEESPENEKSSVDVASSETTGSTKRTKKASNGLGAHVKRVMQKNNDGDDA